MCETLKKKDVQNRSTKLMLMVVVSIEFGTMCEQVDLFIRRVFPPGETRCMVEKYISSSLESV